MKRRGGKLIFCIWGTMISFSIPTRRAIWNQRITGFWVFETRENPRTIFSFGYSKTSKNYRVLGI
jgi:hypothetical protein